MASPQESSAVTGGSSHPRPPFPGLPASEREQTVVTTPRPDSAVHGSSSVGRLPTGLPSATPSPTSLRLFPEQRLDAEETIEGERLGHFVIRRRIGAGGMGTVFLADDEKLQRQVALKVLSPQQTADPSSVQRFQNEARAAARLDHDHIARVFFYGDDHDLHYIAYEYIQGHNLRDLIRGQGRLEPAEVVTYAVQLAAALCHTSAHGVIHRDIKPSNIIITQQGKAKLVDLGLARKESLEESAQLTVAGTTLGTFDYISPEQAKDPRNVDVRSDIYSLGCTLYHALTGEPPFPEGTVLQRLLDHSTKDPPDPALKNRRVSPALSAVVGRMMASDPRRRYPSAEALLQDLLTIGAAMGLRTVPEGTTNYGQGLYATRQSWWAQNVNWVITAAVLFVGAAIWQALPMLDATPTDVAGGLPYAGPSHLPPPTAGSRVGTPNDRQLSPERLQDATMAVADQNPGSLTANEPQRPTPALMPSGSDRAIPPGDMTGSTTGPSPTSTSPPSLIVRGTGSSGDSTPGETTTAPINVGERSASGRTRDLPGEALTRSSPTPSVEMTPTEVRSPTDPTLLSPLLSPFDTPLLSRGLPTLPAISGTGKVTGGSADPMTGTSSGVGTGTVVELSGNPKSPGGSGIVASSGLPIAGETNPLPAGGFSSPLAVSAAPFVLAGTGERFATLDAACGAVREQGVIELHFDGRLADAERPLRLTNKRLTIQAARGRRPVLWFAPREGIADPPQSRMITVNGGSLSLVNVAVDLQLRVGASAELWALFRLERPERLRLDRCFVTVHNPAHAAAVVVEAAVPLPSFTKMSPMKDAQPLSAAEIVIENSVIRGEATGLKIRDAAPLLGDFRQSLFALGEWMIAAEPASDLMLPTAELTFSVSDSTALTGLGFLKLSPSDDLAERPWITKITARNNLFSCGPGAALIDQEIAQETTDFRQTIRWSGDRNHFDQLPTMWVVRYRIPPRQESWDPESWNAYWNSGTIDESSNQAISWTQRWRGRDWASISPQAIWRELQAEATFNDVSDGDVGSAAAGVGVSWKNLPPEPAAVSRP